MVTTSPLFNEMDCRKQQQAGVGQAGAVPLGAVNAKSKAIERRSSSLLVFAVTAWSSSSWRLGSRVELTAAAATGRHGPPPNQGPAH